MRSFKPPPEPFVVSGKKTNFILSSQFIIFLIYNQILFRMYVPENWLPFIIAILLPMILGSLWYGPIFGKMWMRMMGLTQMQIKEKLNPAKSYGGSLVGSVLTAYVLSLLISYLEMGTLVGGMTVGFAAWVGFALPTGWQSVAWEDKGLGLFILNQAYNLVLFLGMAGLMGAWR